MPAALDLPPVAPPQSKASPVPGRSARKPKVTRGNSAFEDMFKEGEAKSKEEDFAPSKKADVAPPPRVGLPPSKSLVLGGDTEVPKPEAETHAENEGL